MFVATSKVWPVVNLINFSVVPLQHRMLVSQVVNLFWGIYLSCKWRFFDMCECGVGRKRKKKNG